jgi:NAD(P)-dependent dehydrogenase (short-subunit alcohol dehydrogenase family)/rhamnose utilization protein RhaD (predicted bifunctional aldolase and dehydrogenase)
MSLTIISELSRKYGSNPAYVLAGGGNTSYKDEQYLYVKPSGVALASITENDFVKMDRARLRSCFELGEFASKDEREAAVKKQMEYAVVSSSLRPSVEAPMHEIMPFTYIVHMHPGLVNGMTCANDGKVWCEKLFPDALWVDYCDPGFVLAKTVYDACLEYKKSKGCDAKVIFLQNHGVFVGGNSAEEIDSAYELIMEKLAARCAEANIDISPVAAGQADIDTVMETAPLLRSTLAEDGVVTVTSSSSFTIPGGPLTPDHLVYAKAFGLSCETITDEAVAQFKAKRNYLPRMVEIPGKAAFFAGKNKSAADTVLALALNGAYIEKIAGAFGGVHYLSDAQREFIENWEVESYRAKVAAGANSNLTGLVAVVTGGAQGFGLGIAEELAKAGADVVVADMNADGAVAAAKTLGKGATGFAVNVADEESVEKLVQNITATYGGVDLLVANAGVARASSVKTFEMKDWKFVTDVNYNGFFICTKYFARIMSVQNAKSNLWTDIVQVNSKSGLAGSKNNGAYAGSKFGGLGLVQSFALELVADKIKVNAVCPGNFLDGPLWSDPERGLFVQYLNAGKVPGAKTVEDVRRHYESLVPMNRGCFPADVAKAIIYAVTQKYETGQAIPVTGGQIMLN